MTFLFFRRICLIFFLNVGKSGSDHDDVYRSADTHAHRKRRKCVYPSSRRTMIGLARYRRFGRAAHPAIIHLI